MRKKFLKYISLITALTIVVTGCTSQKSMYGTGGDNYEDITSIMDVKFSVPKQFTQTATAITEISDQAGLSQHNTYLYKDGSKQFLLFNMDQIVVAAEYGTNFFFADKEDKAGAFNSANVMGVWLSPENTKEFEYEESVNGNAYKLIGTVKAQAVVTTDLYNDFVGKVATLSNGTSEWSIFIGAPGEDYDALASSIKDTIDMVARSLRPNMDVAVEDTYDVSLGQDGEDEAGIEASDEAVTEITVEDVAEEVETATEEISIEEPAQAGEDSSKEATEEAPEETPEDEPSEASESASEETSIEQEAPSEAEEEAETSENAEPEDATAEEKPEKEPAAQEEPVEESEEDAQDTGKGLNLNNQKQRKLNEEMTYYSDIYSLLGLGHKGFASVINDNLEEESVQVKLNKVYMNDTADQMVREYTTKAGTGYIAPPTGTKWEVAEYDITYAEGSENPYVNIKMTGLDGKRLNHLGIAYSTRTYDMFEKTEGSGTYMVYYAVPSTCLEYVLVCGDGNIDNKIAAAYYHIKKR